MRRLIALGLGLIFLSGSASAASVTAYGAVGGNAALDTAGFQAAINAACGPGGDGKVHVPPAASNYLVDKINQTNCNDVIIEGDGDRSRVTVNGSDTFGNWWDLSGSNNIQFKNLRFVDNGSPVAIVFLWACTGVSCGTSGVLSGLSFDHVNMNVKHTKAGLFAYGYGCAANCATNISGGSLNVSNSAWKNTHNGVVIGERTRNAVVVLSAYNAGNVRSSYVALTTSTAIAARTHFYNLDAIDHATTGSVLSNNAAAVTDGVNQMTVIGGSFQCQCVADFIGWTSDEALSFNGTAFTNPVGGCTTKYWMEFGGGVNSVINLTNPFWSCPGDGGAFIALDGSPSAGNGGIWYLTVLGNDVGLNTYNMPFIGQTYATGGSCGVLTPVTPWIIGSNINLIDGANRIITCGSIDSHVIFQNVGTVVMPGGSTDYSHHF